MKKILLIASALFLLGACQSIKDEFTPVFTFKYPEPPAEEGEILVPNMTIAEVAGLYKTGPVDIRRNLIIEGVVTTTDQPGNFYKTLYIQDYTGGIELKMGRNGLYNDYPLGQHLYVKLNGLTIGMYGKNNSGNGMIGIGFTDPTGDYETAFLENKLLIDRHVIKVKGPTVTPLEPEVITDEKDLPYKNSTQKSNHFLGKFVTLKGLKYANEAFVLLYLNSKQDTKSYTNRVFLSPSNVPGDPTAGITTWAMSKDKMTEYLTSGRWDAFRIGSGNNYTGKTLGDYKEDGTYPGVEKAAYSVSQYFMMGNTPVQLRTSGYSKFSDLEIPKEVLNGTATVDMTGILTLYQGNLQFTINDIRDILVNY